MTQQIIKSDFIDHFLGLNNSYKEFNTIIFTSSGNLKRGYESEFVKILNHNPINEVEIFTVDKYPDLNLVTEVLNKKKNKTLLNSLVLSIGGGSAMDIAKLYSSCMTESTKTITDISEIKKDNENQVLSIAIPTTSGSGAESTKFTTIWDEKNKQKLSFEDESMLPDFVYLNPKFLVSLPKSLTLSTCLDALCHSLDSLWNKNKTPESIQLSIEALEIINKYLPLVLKDLANLDIREKLLEASNLSGQAINISRTSLNHSISYPLTSLYKIPHGIACAFSVVSIIKKFYKKINEMPGGNLIIESGNILNTLNLNEDFENLFGQSFDSTDISKIVLMNSRVTNFEFEISSKDLNEIIQNSYNLYSSN